MRLAMIEEEWVDPRVALRAVAVAEEEDHRTRPRFVVKCGGVVLPVVVCGVVLVVSCPIVWCSCVVFLFMLMLILCAYGAGLLR